MWAPRSPSKFTAFLIILWSFAIAALTFAIPVAPGVENPVATHWRTAIAACMAFLFIGAGVWFLSGLKSFKSDLRVAYRMLAIGIIMFSVALLQLPIFGLFDLWATPWADSGGAIVPFVVAAALMYLGLRRFARLLQVKHILRSFVVTFVITTLFALGVGVAAHFWVQYTLEGVDVYIAIVAWAAVYLFCAALLAGKITSVIGESYQNAMQWLTVAITGLSLSGLHEFGTTFYLNNGYTYEDYGIYLWPFLLTGFLFVRASYAFYALGVHTPVIAVEAPPNANTSVATDHDYIDSVVSIATLASRPKAIDPILDDLRIVTSRQRPNVALSSVDRQQLVSVYSRLENYLTSSDPLRSFSKAELRGRVSPAFRAIIEKSAPVSINK